MIITTSVDIYYTLLIYNADVSVTKDLNVCWNSVYRRLFHYNRWDESVKCCIKGLGRLDLVHILALQKLKFWYKIRHSSNRTVCNMSMFLSRVSILLLTRDIDIVILSVCLSVCLSVTRWYCMKTA